MAVNIPGIISLVVFYLLILLVGIWAFRKKGKSSKVQGEAEDVILAGRNISLIVGIFTTTATWVGGGYINGSAEIIYSSGLVWCQAPIGYTMSLILGGLFFAKPMRNRNFVTMLDPMQEAYGPRMGGLLFIPALFGEVLWSASILAALGSTMSVIIGLDFNISVIISASIAIFYTLIGGLYSVAYTDVVQLLCIFFGLWLSVPFALTHEAVSSINVDVTNWIGSVDVRHSAQYIDNFSLLLFGGIPWQVYFQRVLSAKTATQAQVMSFAASFGCLIMVLPAILIGAIGKATDWSKTAYGHDLSSEDVASVLPLVLQYLTPTAVSFFGLGAVSAAVMSSADSSILSCSSLFSRNVYKLVIRNKATDKEIIWVMRISILASGVIATSIALSAKSIYALFFICSDLVFVMLFPQLLCALHFPHYVNTYGSSIAYFLSFILRGLTGDTLLKLPAVIKLPYFDEQHGQLFPFRTLIMLIGLCSLFLFSALFSWLFNAGKISKKYDFLKCFTDEINLKNDIPLEDFQNREVAEEKYKMTEDNFDNRF
ncbi:Uncharacterised protein g6293 [Pycnogonum litorale]